MNKIFYKLLIIFFLSSCSAPDWIDTSRGIFGTGEKIANPNDENQKKVFDKGEVFEKELNIDLKIRLKQNYKDKNMWDYYIYMYVAMIVLSVIFTLFIVGMGWLLGDLQNGDPESAFFVQSANGALQQLCFFVFFVVSLAAIGVSVDSFHKERQANTLNILLAKPINRETVVVGKALGLSLVVGIPAFAAQILGLMFMINAGDYPTTSGILAFIICGQIMIFTLI